MNTTCRRGALLALAIVALALVVTAIAASCSAQTEPPALGIGDWVISDDTVIENRFVLLRGSLLIGPSGELTLRNSTVLFGSTIDVEYGITVASGGTLRVIEGSTLGSSRVGTAWSFLTGEDSHIRVLNSTVAECGMPFTFTSRGYHDHGMYLTTPDAVIADSRFQGGFIGAILDAGEEAVTVRNCTFETYYGVITFGTSLEDCTFKDQGLYGVFVFGGTGTSVRRCTFEGIFGSGVQVGWVDVETDPPTIYEAWARVEDCSFRRSQNGVWTASESHVVIQDCSFDDLGNIGFRTDTLGDCLIVNSHFTDCNKAVEAEKGSFVNWTVTNSTLVTGGPVTISGNLLLEEGAVMRLLECRNVTILNEVSRPITIKLEKGAHLEIVNGSLEIPKMPDDSWVWVPFRLEGAGASLSLTGVNRINLSYPIELSELSCFDSTLPLGTWRVGKVHLEDCDLVRDPHRYAASLVINADPGTEGMGEAGRMVQCNLDGLASLTGARPWLVLEAGRLTSLDTISGVVGLMEANRLQLPDTTGLASLEVSWSGVLSVHWQNQAPIPGAEVELTDSQGNTRMFVADDGGKAYVQELLTEVASNRLSVLLLYPFEADVNISGLHGSVRIEMVDAPLEVSIPVLDLVPPVLTVDQGEDIATNDPDVLLTGHVIDVHSGVAFLEVAVLPKDHVKVTVGEDGSFVYNFTADIGLQVVSLRLYDQVGNRVQWRVAVYHTIDPPFIIIEEPLNDTWVNTTYVFLVGQTEANSTMAVKGLEQMAEDGTFRMRVPLEEGVNVLKITSTNLAGNTNTVNLSVLRDSVPPELEVSSPPESPHNTNAEKFKIVGRAENGSKVFINTAELGVSNGSSFMATVNLDEGYNVVTVRAVDGAGNAATIVLEFWVDSIPPHLQVLWPPHGLMTNATSVSVEVQTDVGANLTINGEVIMAATSEVIYPFTLEEGQNVITVTASDAAGNLAELTVVVEVDRSPPSITLDGSMPNRTSDIKIRLAGRTDPNSTVRFNGAALAVDQNGSFFKILLLNEGMNHIVVFSTDEFGNQAQEVFQVEMIPSKPPPKEKAPSLIPLMLVITLLVLTIEGVFLLWRKRVREMQEETNHR
jgi:hypothetical protein